MENSLTNLILNGKPTPIEVSEEDLIKIKNWIDYKVIAFEKWYPEKTALTAKAVEAIKELMQTDILYNYEFNADYSKIRKVDFDFKKPIFKNKKKLIT